MRKKKGKLSDQLRAAIDGSDLSQNEIARRSGVDVAVVNKFVRGRRAGISTAAWDALAEVLGLRLLADQEAEPPAETLMRKKRKGN